MEAAEADLSWVAAWMVPCSEPRAALSAHPREAVPTCYATGNCCVAKIFFLFVSVNVRL